MTLSPPHEEVPKATGCEWCDRGDVPRLTDLDGTFIEVSKALPGKYSLCHAMDVFWWVCTNQQRQAQAMGDLFRAGVEAERARAEAVIEAQESLLVAYRLGSSGRAVPAIDRLRKARAAWDNPPPPERGSR